MCVKTAPGAFQESNNEAIGQKNWSKYWPLCQRIFNNFTVRDEDDEDAKEHPYVRMEAYALLAELIENDNSMKRNFEDNEDRLAQIFNELHLFDKARYYSRLGSLNDSIKDAEKSWKLYLLADSNRFGVQARKQQKELAALCFDALHYKEVRAIVKTCKKRKE